MPGAIDRVRHEHAREEQDFRDQEQPHAHFCGVKLLLRGHEVVLDVGWLICVRVRHDAVFSSELWGPFRLQVRWVRVPLQEWQLRHPHRDPVLSLPRHARRDAWQGGSRTLRA